MSDVDEKVVLLVRAPNNSDPDDSSVTQVQICEMGPGDPSKPAIAIGKIRSGEIVRLGKMIEAELATGNYRTDFQCMMFPEKRIEDE